MATINLLGIEEIHTKFADVFRGREDVCGRISEDGKKGWCDKTTVTLIQYIKHLTGNSYQDSLGIYPLLDDGNVWFGVIDVDNHQGEDNAELAVTAAKVKECLVDFGIESYIEVSKSGGYHIWVFFGEPVSAANVRRLLKATWTKAVGQKIPEIFPKQDRLSSGQQYGNFIHLPYFGPHVANKRRVFVNGGDYIPLEDFLNNVIRHSAEELNYALSKLPVAKSKQLDYSIKPISNKGLLPCAQAFIENGALDGPRRPALFRLAAHLHRAGYAYEEALDEVRLVDLKSSNPIADEFGENKLEHHVRSAYEGQGGYGYVSFGCEQDDWIVRFCPGKEKCPAMRKNWPKDLPEEAFYGLAGEVVRTISPYSEADDAALLLNFLVAFGNVIGTGPHYYAGPDRHGTNLFAVLVGETAKGRKGASWGWIKKLFTYVDDEWVQYKTPGGLSSGEGLIWQVRDSITQRQPIKDKGRVIDYQDIEIDPGVQDKRLLVVEAEFSSALKVMTRQGNTLSDIIRKAWDGETVLASLTKNSIAMATKPHISVLGHTTKQELLKYLTDIESGNGFANRFLWVCVKRSKYLPDGAILPAEELNQLALKVNHAVAFATNIEQMYRDDEANKLWREIYPHLSDGKKGLLGSMIARAEAQVLRLACIYALLDISEVVRLPHLEAAIAVWGRCEASAQYIFGNKSSDRVEEKILDALRKGPLTQTDIIDLFNRNLPASSIKSTLENMEFRGIIIQHNTRAEGSCKPTSIWSLK